MPSPLELYHRGSRDRAWDDLLEWGPLEVGTAAYQEAEAVARETMDRASRSLELILSFLRSAGYRFRGEDEPEWPFPSPWMRPTNADLAAISELAARYGPLPLSLRVWWETIGEVNLSGRFRGDEALAMNDALEVDGPRTVLRILEGEEPQCQFPAEHGNLGIDLELAADSYHKAEISGGLPYAIHVPDQHADAPLHNLVLVLPHPPGRPGQSQIPIRETFVEYLRRSFLWAGFPGYATLPVVPHLEQLGLLFGRMERL